MDLALVWKKPKLITHLSFFSLPRGLARGFRSFFHGFSLFGALLFLLCLVLILILTFLLLFYVLVGNVLRVWCGVGSLSFLHVPSIKLVYYMAPYPHA